MNAYSHRPVLLKETLELLQPAGGVFVDGTLGGGGHAEAILQRLDGRGRLIGIDRDPAALAAARQRLARFFNFSALRGNFFEMRDLLMPLGVTAVRGILLDLGVSSYQLDTPERGFSYSADAPLDMRMNPDDARSAYDVVNGYGQDDLARILSEYGEERFARRIAQRIVREREKKPVTRTGELVEIVRGAIPAPARREGGHPAKRTFQAIRIEVNGELAGLEKALEDCVKLLDENGVLAVITFHSLEDRIVKHLFRRLCDPCTCPKSAPACVCGKTPETEPVLRKAVTAGDEERTQNPRAQSARLRAVRKRRGSARPGEE